jgi:hypothetical protein
MNPKYYDDGVPMCADDDCSSFDGKRCKMLGARPGAVCEPAVVKISCDLKQATETLAIVQGDARAYSDEVIRCHGVIADFEAGLCPGCRRQDELAKVNQGLMARIKYLEGAR